MGAFQTKVDIGNRALQHCGASRMDPTLGFSENSRNAAEVSACYDQLREAELQANAWTCAIRRTIIRAIDANTMLLSPALWSEFTTYFVGSIVADGSDNLWISNTRSNLGNDPLLTNAWDPYFGPLSVSLYGSTTTSYFSGEVVYTAAGDGRYRVYLSLQDGNTDVPATSTAYASTTTYFKNQVVTYLSVSYMSLIDLSIGNTPNLSPAPWAIGTTYSAGAAVAGSDGVKYTSIAGGNVGNDPTTNPGTWTNTGVLVPWTTVFTGGIGSDKWLQIGGLEAPSGVALVTLGLVYPLGSGPSTQQASRNVFKLPAGYLREAAQNPKATTTWLGGPLGVSYNDWNLENGYLVTAEAGPISLRFVANLTDVRRMSAMFCEGLAARIALAICDTITQSGSQLQIIAKVYSEWIDQAKTRNAIEQGYDVPPDDDWITVRL